MRNIIYICLFTFGFVSLSCNRIVDAEVVDAVLVSIYDSKDVKSRHYLKEEYRIITLYFKITNYSENDIFIPLGDSYFNSSYYSPLDSLMRINNKIMSHRNELNHIKSHFKSKVYAYIDSFRVDRDYCLLNSTGLISKNETYYCSVSICPGISNESYENDSLNISDIVSKIRLVHIVDKDDITKYSKFYRLNFIFPTDKKVKYFQGETGIPKYIIISSDDEFV